MLDGEDGASGPPEGWTGGRGKAGKKVCCLCLSGLGCVLQRTYMFSVCVFVLHRFVTSTLSVDIELSCFKYLSCDLI